MVKQIERAREIDNEGAGPRGFKNILKGFFASAKLMAAGFLKGIQTFFEVGKAIFDTHVRRLYGWAQQVVQKGIFVSISDALGAVSKFLFKKATDPVADTLTVAHEEIKTDTVVEKPEEHPGALANHGAGPAVHGAEIANLVEEANRARGGGGGIAA